MPVSGNIVAPASAQEQKVSDRPLFIAFISSIHPETGESWCTDVRIALPLLDSGFAPIEAPDLVFIEVGQRPERKAENAFRTD
ncbi:hypothetical protein BKA65DRAFT_555032 [Rhexocercosporidium sp. MPI-PUGE-AT-0058]|nr:hypothetical protein BKA65DRAFT_555032 [Rhexocercosporidium sp. MPI-PUGE-AT-0058]